MGRLDLAGEKQEHKPGIALLCDPRGVIMEVLYDTLGVPEAKLVGKPLTQLIDRGSLDKLLNFFVELRKNHATFDWEMNIPVRDRIMTLHFMGIMKGEQMLVLGAPACEDILALNEDMLLMENEDINALRMAIKEKRAFIGEHSRRDAEMFDENSRLNNELASLHREISKKNAELRKSESNLTKSQEMAHIGSWELNIETDEMRRSDESYHIFGAVLDGLKISYEEFITFIVPGDRARVKALFKSSRETGRPFTVTYNITRKDGQVRTIISHGEAMFDLSGQIVKIFGTNQDITEQKQAEEKLREKGGFTTTLMGNLPGMVYRRRNVKDWTMEFLSSGCFKLTGYKIEDLFNDNKMSYGQLIHPDDTERVWDETQTAIHTNMRYMLTYRIITARREEKWVLDQGRGIIKYDRILLEGVITDITERKRVEEALAVAKTQVDLYVDLLGHDINNMNQIARGNLELILMNLEQTRMLDASAIPLLKKSMESLDNSSRLIKNVQKLQRASTEGKKLQKVDVAAILKGIVDELRSTHGKEVTIHYKNAAYPCLVTADDLLRDLFTNIISNAIKHSGPESRLTIGVEVESVDEGGKIFWRVAIEDNGPGIPDDVKSRLFQRFSRGQTKALGSGLGLYLVRTLVEYYGGRIKVEDRVPGDYSKGAKFVVLLPSADD